MIKSHNYKVSLSWTGATHGPTSPDRSYSREFIVKINNKPDIRGSSDTPFKGDPALHNPEDLLLSALASCHMLSYLFEASRAGLPVLAYEDEAVGTMEIEAGRGRFTEVILRPKVTVAPGSDIDLAKRLQEKAHAACFIANSVNFPVRNEAEIRVG